MNDTIVPNINIWKDSEAFLCRKKVFFDVKFIISYYYARIVLCKCHIAYAVYYKIHDFFSFSFVIASKTLIRQLMSASY